MNVLNEKMLRLLLLSFFWINCMLAYGQSVTVILSKTNIADQKRDAGNQECYKIQLKNKSSKPIGLAGQNYRLYYNSDAVILDENDIENFLPDTYTSLELIQHEFDVDATGFGILPYESHLGFINLATDYKLSSGSPVMLGVGKTIDVAGLCFYISDSKQSSDLTWAHEDVTQSYATAFVEIATVEGSRLKKLHIDDLVVEGTATSVWQQERVLNFDYFPNPFT
ncbi:MAG: hypothetical protein LC107_12045, partial [Chitinophagales bacterium]|nr:hypothetical protein [Chitinophagales bacterium]